MNKVALAIDFELTPFEKSTFPIEIGLTEINLNTMEIIKVISFPIKTDLIIPIEIVKLTGWTHTKLQRVGYDLAEVCEKIEANYGGRNRLLIVDQWNEFEPLKYVANKKGPVRFPFGKHVFNVSDLYSIKFKDFEERGLEYKLKQVGLEFEGKPHKASWDSLNIAKLFIKLMEKNE